MSSNDRTIAALEFRNVSKSFEGEPAIDDVSFSLSKGQMIVITGVSRSGKSVLLHLAIGLTEPDSGEILIEGTNLRELDESELLALRSKSLGIVFQEDTLFSGMSTYENAAYRLSELGWTEQDEERAVMEILRFVGLEKDIEKLPEELSVGMRRRLEIARALAGWPQVMLFDEPTAGLDPIKARQVLDLIIRARDVQNISSLQVTKELHEIPYLAKHHAATDPTGAVRIAEGRIPDAPELMVMVLDQGKIAFFGSPEEFDRSSQPAVLQMKQPEGPQQGEIPSDPWRRIRKKR